MQVIRNLTWWLIGLSTLIVFTLVLLLSNIILINIETTEINNDNINVLNCEYNSSGLTGNFYVNNTSITSFSSLPASGTTNTFFGSISADTSYSSAGSGTIDGIIYEIIIINRLLTSTERTNIYTTLNTKWMI